MTDKTPADKLIETLLEVAEARHASEVSEEDQEESPVGNGEETVKVSAIFARPEEKKHSVKFNEAQQLDEDQVPLPMIMQSVYIRKDALKQIGNPKKVRITLEAADG